MEEPAAVDSFQKMCNDVGEQLNAEGVAKLSNLCGLPAATRGKIKESCDPSVKLLEVLKEGGNLSESNVKYLYNHLREAKLVEASLPVKPFVVRENVKNFQRKLEEIYQRVCNTVRIVPWEEIQYSVDQLYNQLHIEGKVNEPHKKEEKITLASHHEIFTHSVLEKEQRILIEGDPGCGKTTTTLQIAHDWLSRGEKDTPMTDVDLLILLPFRHLKKDSLFCEAVHDLLLDSADLTVADVRDIMESGDVSKVIVMDGYDELPWLDDLLKTASCLDTFKILTGEQMQTSKVIVTARKAAAREIASEFALLTITGFSEKQKRQYIFEKAFDHDKKKGEKLQSYLKENKLLGEISKIPLLLALICEFHRLKDGGLTDLDTQPSKITPLFTNLCQCYYIHYKRKQNKAVSNKQLVTTFGKIALDGLIDGKLFWDKDWVKQNVGKEVFKLGICTGLFYEDWIGKEVSFSDDSNYNLNLQKKAVISCCHKLIQEKIAAEYLGYLSTDNKELLNAYLNKIFRGNAAYRFHFLLRFACGENMAVSKEVICRLQRTKPLLIMECFYECNKDLSHLNDAELCMLNDVITYICMVTEIDKVSSSSIYHKMALMSVFQHASDLKLPINRVCLEDVDTVLAVETCEILSPVIVQLYCDWEMAPVFPLLPFMPNLKKLVMTGYYVDDDDKKEVFGWAVKQENLKIIQVESNILSEITGKKPDDLKDFQKILIREQKNIRLLSQAERDKCWLESDMKHLKVRRMTCMEFWKIQLDNDAISPVEFLFMLTLYIKRSKIIGVDFLRDQWQQVEKRFSLSTEEIVRKWGLRSMIFAYEIAHRNNYDEPELSDIFTLWIYLRQIINMESSEFADGIVQFFTLFKQAGDEVIKCVSKAFHHSVISKEDLLVALYQCIMSGSFHEEWFIEIVKISVVDSLNRISLDEVAFLFAILNAHAKIILPDFVYKETDLSTEYSQEKMNKCLKYIEKLSIKALVCGLTKPGQLGDDHSDVFRPSSSGDEGKYEIHDFAQQQTEGVSKEDNEFVISSMVIDPKKKKVPTATLR